MTLREQLHEAAKEPAGITAVFDLLVREIERLCDEVRKLRAMLHNAAKHGLQSQNRDGHPDFGAYLRGRVAFVCMVDPMKGAKLREALRSIEGVG